MSKTKSTMMKQAAVFGLAVFTAFGAWADIVSPLYVGNTEPVLDEFGCVMEGCGDSNSSLIELRSGNTIIARARMGEYAMKDSGLFCVVFPQRLTNGQQVVARAYNAPTAAEATFYAESMPVRVKANDKGLTLSFKAAQPMDPELTEFEGEWISRSLATQLARLKEEGGDQDGDGVCDYDEWLAGTAMDDETSRLAFEDVGLGEVDNAALMSAQSRGVEPVKPVRVSWQSVPGKTYQLQYSSTLSAPEWKNVGEPLMAEAEETQMVVDVVMEEPEEALRGVFRIRLVR